MKKKLYAGTNSHIERLFIQDSSQTDGRGLTGLVYNSAGLTAYYIRQGDASPTQISLVTATVGTWVSGGFKEISSANMPGWYELHVPDAAIAAGAKSVGIHLKGATNMAPYPIELELDAVNYQDAVRLGLTALPNAAAEAAGGLFTRGSGAGQIAQDANGRISVNLIAILGTLLTETAGQIAAGFKQFFNVATPTSTMNRVTLVDTTTANTDMRGTDGANTTAPDNAGIAAAAASAADLQTRVPAALSGGRMPAVLAATPPTAAEIDTQLSGSHGAGAWGPSDATGDYQVTITVVDDDTDEPLFDAGVTVKSSGGAVHGQGRTDADGEFVIPANTGNWTVSVANMPGYTGVSNQAFSVAAADKAVEVRLVPIAATSVSAGTRVVRVIVVNGSGVLQSGIVVTAKLIAEKSSITNAFTLTTQLTETTNANGIADLVLITEDQFADGGGEGTGEYVIEIPGAGSRRLAIPAGSGVLNLQVQVAS